MKTTWWWVSVLVVGTLGLAGCARSTGPSGSAKAVTLVGAGATFPYPLYSKWFDDYSRETPGVRISYNSIGSGGGIQQLKNGTVDFGASDAPLSDAESKEMPRPVVHIPTVAGAVAMVYNVPGVTDLRLSGDTVAGIFLGRIKRWNDRAIAAINPGVSLPDLAIAVAHRSDGSGTTYIFTHYLGAVSKTWASQVGMGKSIDWPVGIGGKGNEGVTGVVKQTPGGIGYVELAYAVQNKMTYARIRNAAGKFIEPSVASTTAAAIGAAEKMKQDIRVSIVNSPGADAYPISGFTYLLLYREQQDPAKGQALKQFLGWAMQAGQKAAAPLMYAPLPPAVVDINEAAIAGIQIAGDAGGR